MAIQPEKVTKESVQYGESTGHDCCGICVNYRSATGDGRTGVCVKVRGIVEEDYWCQLFRQNPAFAKALTQGHQVGTASLPNIY